VFSKLFESRQGQSLCRYVIGQLVLYVVLGVFEALL